MPGLRLSLRSRSRRRLTDPALASALGKCSGILDLRASTAVGGEWPTVVDTLNPGSPMTQPAAIRKAAVGTDPTFPSMVFDGTDVHKWPQSPAHAGTAKVGIWLWFKPAALGGGIQWLYSVLNGVGGSTTNRFRIGVYNTNVYAEVYSSNTDGRAFTSAAGALAIGAWHCFYLQYDSSRGGDANLRIYVNGVSLALTPSVAGGAGSTLGALQAASGSATLGGFNDSDTPTQPITNGGEIGPYIRALTDNLTAAEIAALMAADLAPSLASALANVSAWFRVARASNLGSGLAFTLPNVLNGNHATSSTDARKPTIAASANGLPILTCSASALQVPLHAAINGATKWGFGAWLRVTTAAGNPVPVCIDSGGGGAASLRKILIQRFVGDNILAFDTQTTARRGGPATMWVTNAWAFCTWEMSLDTGEAESIRVIASRNAALQTCVYADSNGTPGSFATSMQVPTGFLNLFAQNAANGSNGWVGDIGPNIYLFGSRMSGATEGLLTPSARAALTNFEAPT